MNFTSCSNIPKQNLVELPNVARFHNKLFWFRPMNWPIHSKGSLSVSNFLKNWSEIESLSWKCKVEITLNNFEHLSWGNLVTVPESITKKFLGLIWLCSGGERYKSFKQLFWKVVLTLHPFKWDQNHIIQLSHTLKKYSKKTHHKYKYH